MSCALRPLVVDVLYTGGAGNVHSAAKGATAKSHGRTASTRGRPLLSNKYVAVIFRALLIFSVVFLNTINSMKRKYLH